MATKLVLLGVACLALSVHALVAPQEMALMQQEIGVANDALFGGQAAPESRSKLRALASEMLDDSKKSTVVAKAAPIKPHAAASQLNLRKAKPAAVPKASPSLGEALLPTAGFSSASGLEDVLMSLMLAKGGQAASPDASTTDKIKKLIEDEMLPKILEAHTADQNKLDADKAAIDACKNTKDTSATASNTAKGTYTTNSPLHKDCRKLEGELLGEKTTCHDELKDQLEVKTLRCNEMVTLGQKLADEATNKGAVTKVIGETDEAYIKRVNDHFCKPVSNLDEYMAAKDKCTTETTKWETKTAECKGLDDRYTAKKAACDSLQKTMDNAACSHATQMKDACEAYSECYKDKKAAYEAMETTVKSNEKDRQAEWRATKRMHCLVEAFGDGKVEDSEVTACKEKTHDTNHLVINYPTIPSLDTCEVPALYPATAEYKLAEFSTLPATAKGDVEANICLGILDVSTTPATGSPTSCKCERITLNGPFGPGALVKCTDCLDVSKSTQANSCPEGTKLFAPKSRTDWATFFASGQNDLKAPHFIVDVTRPQNGCGGCTKHAMNSDETGQDTWKTSDGSAWWLRSTKYNEPNGDYTANCYLHIDPRSDGETTFNDGSCSYHSKSYFCQPQALSLTPKEGSPTSCVCEQVTLTGIYSPGYLLKCTNCLQVYRTTEKNSCPEGSKIFSPRIREDWVTFFNSASKLASPHFIIDVTRPQNGCGGCTSHTMNSGTAAQATWVTSDGTPWWLRDSRYSEPNGDYHANCYLDLWGNPSNADNVGFNDGNCNYRSNAYYCQPAKAR